MRASLVARAGRACWALLAGRDYVVPADVERLFAPVVGHRLVLAADFAVDAESSSGRTRKRIWDALPRAGARPQPDWDEDRFGGADERRRGRFRSFRAAVSSASPSAAAGACGAARATRWSARGRTGRATMSLDRLGRVGPPVGRARERRVRRSRVPRAGGARVGDPRRPAASLGLYGADDAVARQAGGRPLGGRGDRGERGRRARRGGVSRPRVAGRPRVLAAARRAATDRGHALTARGGAVRRAAARPSSSGCRRSSATVTCFRRQLRLRRLRLPGAASGRRTGPPARPPLGRRAADRPGSDLGAALPDVGGAVVPFVDPATGARGAEAIHAAGGARARHGARARLDRALRLPAPRLRSGRRRSSGRICAARGLGGAPAGAAAAGRMRLLASYGCPRPRRAGVRRRPRGALRRRVPARHGRSGPVRAARRRAPRVPVGDLRRPDGRSRRRHDPRASARDRGPGERREARLPGPDSGAGRRRALGCGLDALRVGGAARPARRRARRRRAPATAARGAAPVERLLRALRLVRESVGRAPDDRRRALDLLAASLGTRPQADPATRLAWSAPGAGARGDARDGRRGRADDGDPLRRACGGCAATRRTLALRLLLGLAALLAAGAVVVLAAAGRRRRRSCPPAPTASSCSMSPRASPPTRTRASAQP